MRTSLSRPRAPWTILSSAGRTPRARASTAISARLTSPSTGAADTRTRHAPARDPSIPSRAARGCTRTRMVAPASGLGRSVGGMPIQIRDAPLGGVDGGSQLLDQLLPGPLEGLHVLAKARLLPPSRLQNSLALPLVLLQMLLDLAPGRLPHILGEPMRGDEGLLEQPLALGHAARPLLHGGQLLLEEGVLLQDGLQIHGDVLEEGVDLLRIE